MGEHPYLTKVKVCVITSILLVFWSVLVLFRFFLSILIPLFVGGVKQMVEVRNTYFTISHNPSIFITNLVEPGVELGQVIQRFEALLGFRNGQKYWKLKHFFKHFLGFSFWVEDPKFDVTNHVMEIRVGKDGKVSKGGNVAEGNKTTPIPSSMLQSIETQLMSAPFPEGQSPWALYILRNYISGANEQVDVIFLKCHHGLGDGYSVIKMLVLDVCGESPATLLTPSFPDISPVLLFLTELGAMISAPFVFVSGFLSFDPTAAIQMVAERYPGEKGSYHLVQSRTIELDCIKQLRRRFGVDYSTVVMDGVTAAMRKYLQDGGELMTESLGIFAISPFPFPGHPNEMTNHWSHMDILLPVSTPKVKDRVTEIQSKIAHFRASPMPALTSLKIHEFLGFLPPGWLSWMTGLATFPVTITDFPGPKIPVALLGRKVVDVHFMLGEIPGGEEFLFCSTSFCGRWKLNLSVDKKYIRTKQEAQALVDVVVDYLEQGTKK